MNVFYSESFLLISGIPGFLFFAIEHIRKSENHGKHFVCSGHNSQGVPQSNQEALTI